MRRNVVELASGRKVEISRVNPLSTGDERQKVALLAIEKSLTGEYLLRMNAKVENRMRLITRTDAQITFLKEHLESGGLSQEERNACVSKINEAMDLVSQLEADCLQLQNELAETIETTRKHQFELALWALKSQHGIPEDEAVRELDAQAEIQICACLLGVDPEDAYPSKQEEELKEDEDDSPLSRKQDESDSS